MLIFSSLIFIKTDERIGIVVDSSSNVKNASNFDEIKNSLLHFTMLHSSPKRHKLGLISYGEKPNLDLSFQENQDNETIMNAIKHMR